jgi:hypothetical protein
MKNLVLALFLSFAATTSFAQSSLSGKWATDRPAVPTEATRRERVQLEVTLEDANASGTIAFGGLGGTFHTFKEAKVTGNKVLFRVEPQRTSDRSWGIEMVDDNTVMLYRGDLPLVGSNVLDLIAVLGASIQPAPANPVEPGITVARAGTTSDISGIVQDPSKAFIPRATVTATNVDTGAKASTVTDGSGRYTLYGVLPGKYTMTASVSGFRTTTIGELTIGNTPFRQDFTLELPAPWIAATPTAATCGVASWPWCVLLHRTK